MKLIFSLSLDINTKDSKLILTETCKSLESVTTPLATIRWPDPVLSI